MQAGTGDQSPPSLRNVESEAIVLAGLMRDNARIDRIADVLTPEDFSEQLFGRLYMAVLDLAAHGRPANPITIAPLFDGDAQFEQLDGRTLLTEWVTSLMAATDPFSMARHVRELAVRRRLHEEMLASAARIADLTIETDRAISEHDTAVSATFERTDLNPFRSGVDAAREVMRSFDRKHTGVLSGGGVEGIDRLIGALQPGWLGIVAGRPGMGKTAALISYLRATAEKGHCSLFASLEMSWQILGMRLVADYCHSIGSPVPFGALMKGETTQHHRDIIGGVEHDVGALPFKIIDKKCHTLGQLRRSIRRRKRELQAVGKKLELVVVDYLQLLQPDGKPKSEYEAVSEVSRELKVMAGDEEVAMIALSQLSRAVEQRQDKRPMLSDLRASGQIEQDADFVLFLVSQEYYLRKAEPEPDTADHVAWREKLTRAEGWLEFICAKHRHGEEGAFFGRFYRQFQAVR